MDTTDKEYKERLEPDKYDAAVYAHVSDSPLQVPTLSNI